MSFSHNAGGYYEKGGVIHSDYETTVEQGNAKGKYER